MGKNWYKEKKAETWYRKAKKEGYRARSAYKLMQIQERMPVIRAGDTVVDLGAAPGGWSQVAVELVGSEGRVVGVDLSNLAPMDGAHFVRGDFTKPETIEAILSYLSRDPRGPRINTVLSDMSPDITGNYTMDQAKSVFLCQHAITFARRVLEPGGNLVLKIFEGEDYAEFRDDMKTSFRTVKPYAPPASRKQSSEIYLVGLGFKPPAPARAPAAEPRASRPS